MPTLADVGFGIGAVMLLVATGCASTKLPSGLYGAKPAVAVAAPEFTAVAHNGQTRTAADLMGHPTVVWFYPMAGTPG